MINISRESEINLINILIDQDIISGKDLVEIKKIVEEFQTGVLIKSLSSKDILEGLDRAIELKKSPFFSKKVLKMNTTLNWEKEVEILKATYKSFK